MEPITGMDPRQRQRLGWIVRFFALLLVLTLIARGTARATMAVVTLQKPAAGTVTRNIRTTGSVTFAGGAPFTLPVGLLVLSVPVQAGQTVKAGDTLAVFDPDEVDRAVNAKRAALQQTQTQAAQQAAGNTADPYTAQAAQQQLERAYDQTRKAYAEGQEQADRARKARDEAADNLEKARSADLPEEEKQAAIDAAATVLATAETALQAAEKAAEDANDAALSAAQSVEDSRNAALHALEQEEKATAKQNALDRAAAAVTRADAASLQAELDALVAVQQAGAILQAPMDGTIAELYLKAGQTSPAVGGLLAQAADYALEVPLTADQAKLVAVGTTLHISQSKCSGDAVVQSLAAPDADGTVTAKAALPQGTWSAGAASVTAAIQGERQSSVLPAVAVHQDNSGTYVLAVEQRSTILGQQYVVISLPVTIVESGDTTMAVSGALDGTTQVITASTKAVQAGDRVKTNETA